MPWDSDSSTASIVAGGRPGPSWSVLLTLSGLAVALGVVSFAVETLPWWQVLVPWVLNGVEVVLFLSVSVRQWTRAPRATTAAHH